MGKAAARPPAGYVSLRQACEILGISQPTLHKWRQKRRIPLPQQIGTRLYWRAGVLEDWLVKQPRVTVAVPIEAGATPS